MMPRSFVVTVLAAALPALSAAAPSAASPKEGEIASVRVLASPDPAPRGGPVEVRLELTPASGIKINKYPRIKLKVPAQRGIVAEAEGSVGADKPPPPDELETNYFKTVDPVTLRLELDGAIPAGRHEFSGRLSYFYCVAKSGYCAPAKVDVTIPVVVR